jgi:hypothetical protein
MAEFNPEATDGDGDGFVQDGTEFERPVEEVSVEPEVAEEPAVELAEEVKGDEVISSPERPVDAEPVEQALAPVADGVIGTGTKKKPAKKKPAAKQASDKEETVALYSTRNVTWVGVGRVLTGLNLVPKSQADKWIGRDHIRVADAAEVSKEL